MVHDKQETNRRTTKTYSKFTNAIKRRRQESKEDGDLDRDQEEDADLIEIDCENMTKPKTKKLKYAFGTKKFLGDNISAKGKYLNLKQKKNAIKLCKPRNFGIGTDFTVCMMCDEETKTNKRFIAKTKMTNIPI